MARYNDYEIYVDREKSGMKNTQVDALSDVLSLIRLKGCVYFSSDFSSPWGMELGKGQFAQFHVVVRGQCWLTTHNEKLLLSSGDVVLFPLGEKHCLLDDLSSSTIPGKDVLEAINQDRPLFNNGGEKVRLLCGHFEFDRSIKHPLLYELPRLIHIKEIERKHPGWLDIVTSVLVNESASKEPGSGVIIDRLAEVLFVQTLRTYIVETDSPYGFLAAVKDRRIHHALRIIHAQSRSGLTLAGIAKMIGMSRSMFAERFKELLGITPMNYLTTWRMLIAQDLLISTKNSLEDIACEVGYGSEAAFSRAFRREFSLTPGSYRKSSQLVNSGGR